MPDLPRIRSGEKRGMRKDGTRATESAAARGDGEGGTGNGDELWKVQCDEARIVESVIEMVEIVVFAVGFVLSALIVDEL